MTLEARVINTLAQAIGVAVSELDNNAEFGKVQAWDSMGHIMLIGELERAFGVIFTIQETAKLTSVRQIAECLRAKGLQD
jgi:acyl carrier protein